MKEKYKLLLSDDFVSILTKMGGHISDKILYYNNNNDYSFDLSYIDITDNSDMISFIPSQKIENTRNKWKNNRNSMKIGRFVSRIIDINPNDLEYFVNSYKSEMEYMNDLSRFKIIEGPLISKYYSYKTYSEGGGSLNKSCMRHEHCYPYFDMYANNSDKIKMVILYDRDGKSILGRSLLWYVDEPKIIVMDRIYSTLDSYQFLFIKLAKKNGWKYKYSQRFDEYMFGDSENEKTEIVCKIYIKDIEYKFFPYMDTFLYYDTEKKYLTNNHIEYRKNKNIIKLKSTDGSDRGNEFFVFDIYNNDRVYVDDTIYCEIGDNRILKRDAIVMEYGTFVPNRSRYSKFLNKFLPVSDSIWSSYHDSFIDLRNSVVVYFDDKKEKVDNVHKTEIGKTFFYAIDKKEYLHKDVLYKHGENYYASSNIDIRLKKDKGLFHDEDYDKFFNEFMKKISHDHYMNTDKWDTSFLI